MLGNLHVRYCEGENPQGSTYLDNINKKMRILLVEDEVELTDPLAHVLDRERYQVDITVYAEGYRFGE